MYSALNIVLEYQIVFLNHVKDLFNYLENIN